MSLSPFDPNAYSQRRRQDRWLLANGPIARRPNVKPVRIALGAAVVVGLLCAVLS